MGMYYDPRHQMDYTYMKGEVHRRRELAGRAMGSGPVGAIFALAWLLLVVVFRLLRWLLLHLLLRPLGGVRRRRPRPEVGGTSEGVEAQIRAQRSKR